MIFKILNKAKKHYVNLRGWSTSKKIVVIESDDWGSIRTRDRHALEHLRSAGIDVDTNLFNRYDVLESKKDLENLFVFLKSHKDSKGNNPIITANALVANPDFKAIRESDYNIYKYETIDKTYEGYYPSESVLSYWKQNGMLDSKLLWPQFHGREHFNPDWWLEALKSGDKNEIKAFDEKCLLGQVDISGLRSISGYMAAFDMSDEKEIIEQNEIIKDGVIHFERLFGFQSKSFVAPGSVRSDMLDKSLAENGIKFHQMGQQTTPQSEGYQLINRFWGDINSFGQIYWRRNSTFEPYKGFSVKNYRHDVLEDASIAFRCGKPLVINSHRINFVGGIEPELPEFTISLLDDLIKSLLKKFPDIEFMSSDEMGSVMLKSMK